MPNEYEVYKDLDKFIKSLIDHKELCSETLTEGKEVIFHGSWSSVYRLSMKREGVVDVVEFGGEEKK